MYLFWLGSVTDFNMSFRVFSSSKAYYCKDIVMILFQVLLKTMIGRNHVLYTIDRRISSINLDKLQKMEGPFNRFSMVMSTKKSNKCSPLHINMNFKYRYMDY